MSLGLFGIIVSKSCSCTGIYVHGSVVDSCNDRRTHAL